MNRFLAFFVASLFFAELGWAEHQKTDAPVGDNDQGTLTNGSVIRLPSARGAEGDADSEPATKKNPSTRKATSDEGRVRKVQSYAEVYGAQPKFELPAFGAPLPSALVTKKAPEKTAGDRQPASNGTTDASFAAAIAGISAAAAADRNILALAPAAALTSGALPPSPSGGAGSGSSGSGGGGGGGGGGGSAQPAPSPSPTATASPSPTATHGAGGKGGAGGGGGGGGGGGKGSGEGTATATGGATATGSGGPNTPPKAPPGGTGVVPPAAQKPVPPASGDKTKGGPAAVAPPTIPTEKRTALVNELGMSQAEAETFFKTDDGKAVLQAYASDNVKDFRQAMADAACTLSVADEALGKRLLERSEALGKREGEDKSVSEALKATRPKDETAAPAAAPGAAPAAVPPIPPSPK